MGAYLGVQQGSMFPPQFIHLHYKPENPSENVVKVAIESDIFLFHHPMSSARIFQLDGTSF